MTQTDAEIVARALRVYYGIPEDERAPEADGIAVAVVAALAEAGRLVPEGSVTIDAGRWDRVRNVAAVMLNETLSLAPGDLMDAEP